MSYILFTSVGTGTWTVPSCWNPNLINKIHLIGGGGGGWDGGGGGGGGAYVQIYNVDLRPGQQIDYKIGSVGQTNVQNSSNTELSVATTFGSYIGFNQRGITAIGGYNAYLATNGGGGGRGRPFYSAFGNGCAVGSRACWLNYTKNGQSTIRLMYEGGTGASQGYGGGAAGPNGPGSSISADAGFGGTIGNYAFGRAQSGQNIIPGIIGSGAGGTPAATGGFYGGGGGMFITPNGGAGASGLIVIEYNLGTITSRLTITGTLSVKGEFNEVTTSTIKLTSTTYYANQLDEVSLQGASIAKRETSTGTLMVSGSFDEVNKPQPLY